MSSSRAWKESLEAALRMVTISEALQRELELTVRMTHSTNALKVPSYACPASLIFADISPSKITHSSV